MHSILKFMCGGDLKYDAHAVFVIFVVIGVIRSLLLKFSFDAPY